MPFPWFLVAILIAYGAPVGTAPWAGGVVTAWDWLGLLAQMVGGLGLVGGGAAFAGWLVARDFPRRRSPSPAAVFYLLHAARIVDLLVLGVYAWIIHGLGWGRLVESSFGADAPPLAEEAFTLAPYLLGLVLGWAGLALGERAFRLSATMTRRPSVMASVLARARLSLGMILPLALVLALVQDLVARLRPELLANPWFQLGLLVTLGLGALVLVPGLVRLSWPSHPLPNGPLRDRLETLAALRRFRCTDILVWDTRQSVATAAVTGLWPGYRYVFLSDLLVDRLDDRQIEAVFGHEISHIGHHHVRGLAVFFLGSLGVFALINLMVQRLAGWVGPVFPALGPSAPYSSSVWQLVACAPMFVFVYAVFGPLSRLFEHQADLGGCRAILDDNAELPHSSPLDLWRIKIFVETLEDVTFLNGIPPHKWSWRHGSMEDRIRFLLAVASDPTVEPAFHARVRRIRRVLLGGLILVMALALATRAFEALP